MEEIIVRVGYKPKESKAEQFWDGNPALQLSRPILIMPS